MISPMSNNSTNINNSIQKFLNTNTTTVTGVLATDRENGPSVNERYQIIDNSFIM